MEIKKVPLDIELVGEVIAKDIYNNYGILIIAKNVTINEYILDRMIDFGVKEVYIYRSLDSIYRESHKELVEIKQGYKESISHIKSIIEGLAKGYTLDLNKISKIYDFVYPKSYESRYVIACMNELRSVDEYTYTHSMNVGLYGLLIARWMKLDDKDISKVALAGFLHDIGKSKIPDEILNKKGKLTDDEFEQMKKHTTYGYEVSNDIPDLDENIRNAILMHHEREDGNGYPMGVNGEKLNIYTKIISVADVYDALTSNRVYKGKMTPFDTLREIIKIGYAYFDTKVMMTFLHNIVNYYIGSEVRLNTGEIGQVVYLSPYNTFRPIVKVGNGVIDLSRHDQYEILDII